MKRHAFHREAEDEYAAAAEYYAGIEPELGRRFCDEIERLIRDVRQQPERFRSLDAPIRRHFSDVFLTRCSTSTNLTVCSSLP